MNNEGKKPLWEQLLQNCRGQIMCSSALCCCMNVYQGDICYPHFFWWFCKFALPLLYSFTIDPIFGFSIDKLKEPHHLLRRLQKAMGIWVPQLGPLRGILSPCSSLENHCLSLPVTKGPLRETPYWIAAKKALTCIEKNAVSLCFPTILL